MSKFFEGQRVRPKGKYIDGCPVKGFGTVIQHRGGAGSHGVRWDKKHEFMHDCSGRCEEHHGWYAAEDEMLPAEMENV